MEFGQQDLDFMDMAITLANQADSAVYPNPRVGAVFVRGGEILGKGWHRACGEAHAEVEAFNNAGGDIRQSTLYVTLEPCSHHGRTPPCTDLLIKHGVSKVIFAQSDPNPHVAGTETLIEAGIEVAGPLFRPGLAALTEAFVKNTLEKKTYFTLKWAMTLDGKIASFARDSRWVSNESSRKDVHLFRSKVDGILIGAGTLLSDLPDLGLRHGIKGKAPRPLVWDPRAKTLHAKAWWEKQAPKKPLFISAQNITPPDGAELLLCKDISELEQSLFSHGLHHVLVEGGAGVHGALLDAEIGDRVKTYIAPKLIGGEKALSPVGGHGYSAMDGAAKLKLLRYKQFEEDLLVDGHLKLYHPELKKL